MEVNNYPVGMHPPISAYSYPENIEEWMECPKCGLKPRIWVYDNGRSTHCGCSNDTYDHFSVSAPSIMEVLRRDGNVSKYDKEKLKNNWNNYCESYNVTQLLSICCNAEVKDRLSIQYPDKTDDELRGRTNFYICNACGKACDVYEVTK